MLAIYLSELLISAASKGLDPDTLVLGCTHYPLLRGQIETSLSGHAPLAVIDSAEVTAAQVAERLGGAVGGERAGGPGTRRFYATDSVDKFKTLGSRFLGLPIADVKLVDLGG